MAHNTVSDLEKELTSRGFTISKVYDNSKGICIVRLEKKSTATAIHTNNTSRASLWVAYRRALELGIEQLNLFRNTEGRDI